MARPRPRVVTCGAPVATTIGQAARVPIARDHTNTGSSPTRRTAMASGTSGSPQKRAERSPRTMVTVGRVVVEASSGAVFVVGAASRRQTARPQPVLEHRIGQSRRAFVVDHVGI